MDSIVLVSDIHGNYPALQAVVDAEGRQSKYFILGDVLGLNGYPGETVELLQSLPDATVLRGNHDVAILDHEEGHVMNSTLSKFEVEHSYSGLTDAQISWLKEKPSLAVDTLRGQRICMTHAYPWPEQATGYEPGNRGVEKGQVPEVASAISDDYTFVFHGHTHEQYSLDCSQWGHDVQFVNPGTLGYDGVYATIDIETGDVTFKTVEYDKERVINHVNSKLPDNAPPADEWL